ncbi:MAG: GxxExxY protein [Muribaculaceae bacterium]|nr:GxxExxY protein [Muribaculaceae bacterium]
MAFLIYSDESYKIRGCMLEVHKELGPGFLEQVYQEALEYEFQKAGIPYKREVHLGIKYKDIILNKEYIADFICFDKIIVELKTVSDIAEIHKCQVLNYLKATGHQLGIIGNFAKKSLETARVVNSNNLLYE